MKTALPYKREVYRLWFEYLRLSRYSKDQRIIDALKKSEMFYQPWGSDDKMKFDIWWKTHGHLFEEKEVVRALKMGEMPADPNILVVQIPLTQSPTVLTKRVKKIIQDAVLARGKTNKKSKRVPLSTYCLSEGAEPKLNAVREMLTVYRDVYLKNSKLRGSKLLDSTRKFYLARKSKKWARIPSALQAGDDVVAMRNLRRYITKAEKVMLNVAGGEFPGQY